MKYLILISLFLLSACGDINMRACRNMCGLDGVNEYKDGNCVCKNLNEGGQKCQDQN